MERPERIATLDGLRGLAALAVALLHGCSIFNVAWVPLHAYLAVDFFFLLSCYVIARAFDRRLHQGWVVGFLWRRIVRLYPFIVFGSLLGFLEPMFGGVTARLPRLSEAVLEFGSALLVVPTPPLISPGWRIFPADSPLWSLFYEMAVNFIYAVSAPFLCNRRLCLLVGASGLALACATFLLNGDDFGLVHFKLASLRVLFSFFLGVASFRALGPNRQGFAMPRICAPLIFAVFAVILFAPTRPERLYDLAAVFLGFPLLLLLALRVSPGTARLRSMCLTFGSWSYPVYVLHVPIFVMLFEMFYSKSDSGGRVVGVMLSLATVIALSWLLSVVYDQPVRRWLSGRGRNSSGRDRVVAKTIIRLFIERGYAHRVICGRVLGVMRNRLGMAAPLLNEDRRVLEQIIFPHYAKNPSIHTVLFVGCDSYTAHYGKRYFAGHNYWTLDPDVSRRRFAAKQHVVARLEEVGRYFPHAFFDLIIFNGVYGWGLDSLRDCEAALSQCHRCLRDEGHLVIGWNDLPKRDPAPLSEVSSLSRFSKYVFPAFGGWQYLTQTDNRHTYRFYQKTERGCTTGGRALDLETIDSFRPSIGNGDRWSRLRRTIRGLCERSVGAIAA